MLAQLTTIKSRLGLELFDPTEDALLTNLIKYVSARFAAKCHRNFEYGAALRYEFRANQTSIVVDRPPIQSVSQFELKSNEAEGWIAQSSVSYLLSPKKTVIELLQPLGEVSQIGRVTYTGGYILPGTTPAPGQFALPDDIEQACVEQVAYLYQRRSQLGLLSVSNDSGIVQSFQSTDLLPQVRAVLSYYERWIN